MRVITSYIEGGVIGLAKAALGQVVHPDCC
jgi:hypothetical protein